MSNLFARDDAFFTSTGHLSPKQFIDTHGYDHNIGSLDKIVPVSDEDIIAHIESVIHYHRSFTNIKKGNQCTVQFWPLYDKFSNKVNTEFAARGWTVYTTKRILLSGNPATDWWLVFTV